ncbi:MAG: hypothetical protein JWP27_3079 [Flaviaesturariibacter sp.]|nr:hypothetical protein [Flaviaesturariibacter sp.]
MIEALISGRLQGQPIEKLAKTGKPYVTAKVRVHAGEADVFVNVIAFGEAVCAALLALGSGDAVSLAGTLTPKAWIDKEGAARPALDMVASQVLTAYHVTRKRRALEPRALDKRPPLPASSPEPRDDLDDGRPLDF